MKMTENTEKPEVYKDRTRCPQEVVSSLSSEVFKPRLLKPLGGWMAGGRMSAPIGRLDG